VIATQRVLPVIYQVKGFEIMGTVMPGARLENITNSIIKKNKSIGR
jgi:hypothetical protein